MKAVATWIRGYESQLGDGRGHTVVTDLPPDEDGSDLGTSALELSVLSLAGCITTIFALVARRRRLRFDAMRVELEADRPPGARTITAVHGTIHLTSSAAAGEVETAVRLTLRTCPVGVMFEQAKIPVVIRTDLVGPAHQEYLEPAWRVRPSVGTELPVPRPVPIGIIPTVPLIKEPSKSDAP
jgi:putative redox protein